MAQTIRGDLAKLQSVPREVARWQKAQQALMGGRYSHALGAYQQLVAAFPEVSQLWFELGIAAGGDLDFALAHKAFQTSASLAPKDVSLLVLIGQQYQRLRQLDNARDCYERAVAADGNSTHARLSLAAWLERERRFDDAWASVAECLKQYPRDGSALYFKAFLLHRRGKNQEAEIALRDLIKAGLGDAGVKYSSRHLLGTVLDAQGQYAEALRWMIESKTLLQQSNDTASLQKIYDQTTRQRRELLFVLTPATIQRWRAESSGEANPFTLVFLGGHPRSGTTLVEQILGAHPDIMAFDEPEAFTQEIANEVAPPNGARGLTLDGMNALSAASRATMRQRYFKSLLREAEGEPKTRVLVDKNPSPTASLNLWLRVFPDLKVIIPLRDPRDVIISCFFQNLTLTAGSVNFLSLELNGAAFCRSHGCLVALETTGRF